MTYIQAVPFFMKDDVAAFEYFRKHKAELNAVTGTSLVLHLPKSLQVGDPDDIGSTIEQASRYPGLKLSMLPCLWIEDSAYHFVLPLPNSHDEIKQLVRILSDEASVASSAQDLQKRMVSAMPKAPPTRAPNPWISGSFYLFALLAVLATLLTAARILPVPVLPVVIIGGILGVMVVGAFQLKNDDRLKDEPFVRLMVLTLQSLPLLRGGSARHVTNSPGPEESSRKSGSRRQRN